MGGEFYEKQPLGRLLSVHDSRRIPVRKSDRKPGPYPYYGASGITDWVDSYIFDGTYLLLAEDGENLKTKSLPVAFIAKEKFWVNNHAHVLQGADEYDTRFFSYALKVADIDRYLSGSTRPKLTQRDMKRIPLYAPTLYSRRAIGQFLGNLDDKIELNRQMNRTLEAMARAIFKAWFVDFEPVKAKAAGAISFHGMPQEVFDQLPARLVESELGPVPEGWEVKRLDECVHLTMGQSPPSEYYNKEGIGRPFHQGVSDYGSRFPNHRVFCTADGRLAEPGDVLLSVRAPVGRINVADSQLVLGRGLAGLRHRRERQSFLLYQLYHVFAVEDAIGDGTIYKAVTKRFLSQMPTLSPPEVIVDAFDELACQFDDMIASLTRESRTLASVRDTLLPKLISGELRIPDLHDGDENEKQTHAYGY